VGDLQFFQRLADVSSLTPTYVAHFACKMAVFCIPRRSASI